MSEHTITTNPIRKLPTSLSNQIAAGEVVERPASILKELIENSLDANATQIRIDIHQAGIGKISVTDDGSGIPASELCLAVSPHATSKIYNQEQLGNINTLGFRGEALASIASVSKFEILSRIAGDDTAWKLDYSEKNNSTFDQSDINNLKPVPVTHPIGTTVNANNIFYNTPARKKYLRTERTEYLHVEKLIKQLILSDFNVAFTFVHNSKELYRFQAASDEQARARRLLKICGKEFYENSVSLNFQASGMTLTGWLAKENYSRSSSDIQYFYINGRIIRDRVIFHAIRAAFKDKLPEGRYVAYVLYLTINNELIDVNVHPTKHEVRFNDLRNVHDFLTHVINQALHSNKSNSDDSTIKENFINTISEAPIDYSVKTKFHSNEISTDKNLSNNFFGELLKVIEQRYILTELNSAITLIDIRKAHSFLNQHLLNQQYNETEIITKPLLIPNSIKLEQSKVDVLELNINIINEVGIDFSITGLDTILLRVIPVALTNINYQIMFNNIAEFLNDNKQVQFEDLIIQLCQSNSIDTLNYNSENAIVLLSELNKLDSMQLYSEENNWWHIISIDDFESLFNS